MADKRTVIAPNEELLIQGQLTVVGNVVQVEETTIVTNFANEVLIINADGENVNTTVALNKNNAYGNVTFDGSHIVFSQNIQVPAGGYFQGDIINDNNTVIVDISADSGNGELYAQLKQDVIASDNAVLVDHTAKSFIGTVTSLSNHNTSDLAEDPSATTTSGTMYFTNPRVRNAISVSDLGGDGEFTYDSGTGVISYTGPSSAQVRAHFSAVFTGGDGGFSYDANTGVFTQTGPSASEVRAHFTASNGVSYNATAGTFQAVEAEIQHDSLDGFVANEHIDHTTVDIIAGAGLTGGGDISSSRTLDVVGGDGITANANDVAVDSTVVRTSGTQSIAGDKTFTGSVIVPALTMPSVVANNYTAGDNSTKAASTAYVETAINSLINGAPGTLNTLAELSTALNDDANIGGAVTNNTSRISALEGRQVIAGDGLTGGGDLSANRTLNVVGGDGITANANDVAVDSTVIRTTGNQSLAGTKTFTGQLSIPTSTATVDNSIYVDAGNSTVYALVNGTHVQLTADSDVGQVEDVGTTPGSIDIYAGFRQTTVGNATVNTHGIKSIAGGTYTNVTEASNVITVEGDISNIRQAFSASSGVTYNFNSGNFTANQSDIRGFFGAIGDLSYDSNTGQFSFSERTDSEVRQLFTGSGLISYDSGTGQIGTSADNYAGWQFTTATAGNELISSNELLTFQGSQGITVTHSGSTITITGQNGDISGVTAGTGLSGGGTTGTVTLDLDLSELTDMTNTMDSNDEFIILDGGTAERRKAASEIGLSIFNNDSGFTTNVGDITGVTAGNGLTGGGTSGAVTLNIGTGTGITVAADSIAVNMGAFDTDDLSEGTNLYYTDARAQAVSINNVVEDTTPELGGSLRLNGYKIYDTNEGSTVHGMDMALDTNSIGLGSATNLKFVIDGDNNGTTNYFGVYSNKTITDSNLTDSNYIFKINETGNIQVTGAIGTTDSTADIGTSGSKFRTVYATTFSGTATEAQYADLAENYQADKNYAPGTVVEFGGTAEVTISSRESSPAVAGVVSTDPAHLMNSGLEGDGVVAVALRGRVPCKVYGPVRKGDVLIASEKPGLAKAAPFRGYQTPAACIIGKAISEHRGMAEGVVEILV